MIRSLFIGLLLLSLSGCSLFPSKMCQETVHNPFPQLTKVGVAPFFNLSHEPKVDGRQFAVAYAGELSQVPGYEVVPLAVVEEAVKRYRLDLNQPADCRKLAQVLNIDAIVVGVVTDFDAYYPPRCGMQVEWYTANPGFHPIPPGYGMPWGTPEEKKIPGSVVFDAEMALAREQLKTQTPEYTPEVVAPAASAMPALPGTSRGEAIQTPMPEGSKPPDDVRKSDSTTQKNQEVRTASHEITVERGDPDVSAPPEGLPADWPDPRGFLPPPPNATKPLLVPNINEEPVLKHARTYNGHDAEFTKALENYVFFRDDARFGGWQGYLQRSDDFIRFCCHLHIHEMLAARGGSGETRVVWRWGASR